MLLKIKVKPGSGKSEIVGDIAYLKSDAKEGKANAELLKLLLKKYSRARIVRGLKKREKTVIVE